MKHIAYIRVSTNKQHEGPREQRASIDRWAFLNSVKIDEYYTEVASGGAEIKDRVQLSLAIGELGIGDVLVASKRDRLAREVSIAMMIHSLVERRHAEVAIVDGPGSDNSPISQLQRTMIDAFAQYEREIIQERTKSALAGKMARGEAPGGNPKYGWKKVGKDLIKSSSEQRGLARMKELRETGLSYQKIGNKLTEEGFEPRGQQWHITSVKRAIDGRR